MWMNEGKGKVFPDSLMPANEFGRNDYARKWLLNGRPCR